MIKKLICFIWGHKLKQDALNNNIICARCGRIIRTTPN